MLYKRMPIEKESPEEKGYDTIEFNLAESSVTDMAFGEMKFELHDLKLAYTEHRGKRRLRQLIIKDSRVLGEDDVLVTNGAAGALFIINSSLLNPCDHLIVLRPNYSTNIEVPRTIGCAISYIDLQFEQGWELDVDLVLAAIKPETKLISITTPHNPTGMLIPENKLDALIAIAEERQIFVLIDETYRDTCFKTPYGICAEKSSQVISVASVSKMYGLPGLRTGWLISTNPALMELFLAAKEMIYITNSALDEEIVYQFLLAKEPWARLINQQCSENFETLKKWLSQESRLECILPEGGVVCFPRFTQEIRINAGLFYQTLARDYKTMVGPGHWFEMPDRHMRIGFGWNSPSIFGQGLRNISSAIDDVMERT